MVARTIDAIAVRGEGVFLLLGRLAIAALFVPSGLNKLLDLVDKLGHTGFEQLLAARGLPVPAAWAWAAALVEFLGGLALAIGFKTRFVALLLIAFTIVATGLAHVFWTIAEPVEHFRQSVNFFKNLAIVGGLLFVF